LCTWQSFSSLLGSPSPPLDQLLVCFTLISWLVPPCSDSDLELHLSNHGCCYVLLGLNDGVFEVPCCVCAGESMDGGMC
jgi:hypothetical protein